MSASPRILMVIAFLHHPGGVQRQALLLAKALRHEGLDVRFLTSTAPNGSAGDNIDGIPIRRVAFPHSLKLGPLKFHFMIRGMVRDMTAHADEYDIIHVHQALWPAYAATVAAESVGKPCIIKIGNTGERFDLNVLQDSPLFGPHMARHCRTHADRFVVTSRAAQRETEAFGVPRDRIVLIPNGAELPEIGARLPAVAGPDVAVRQLLGILPDERLVLFVGALRTHKRPLLALESFAALPCPEPSRRAAEETARTRLWFLGDGPLRGKLAQRIAQLGLDNRVRLWGEVADVDPILRAADIFLSSSVAEGMSNALLEAMSHALPCIATRISGSEDLIADGSNGLLIPVDDPTATTNALRKLLSDAAIRATLGEAARMTIDKGYTISSIARHYLHLYDTLRP